MTLDASIMTPIKAEDHLGLVCMVVSKYVPRNIQIEDTEEYSEGVLALLNACREYDPKVGLFSTYAVTCIKKSLIQRWRRQKRKKRQGDANLISINSQLSIAVPKQIDKVAISNVLKEMLADHKDDRDNDKRNKQILHDHFLNEMTWAEIADQMVSRYGQEKPVSRACAQQYGAAALDLIRQRFGIENLSKIEEILVLT